MSIEVTRRGPVSPFIAGLPKVELHLHLDGTLEPGMKVALARRNAIEIDPDSEAGIRALMTGHNDLPSFLAVYDANQEVLRTEQDFEDLAFQYLSTAAADNVRHTEMFFDPQQHTSRGVPFGAMVRGYRRAMDRAREEFGITSALIMCFLRDRGAESAMATLEEALADRDRIIGVGLDSNERDHPPSEYAEVFARARREGFLLTAHCDVDQQNSAEHIRQVIEDIGVDRIDHGLNILESPDLVAIARERGLGFTVCPLPYGTHVVGLEPELRRIARMLDEDLRVSVGSDDPPYFGGYLSDNLQACFDHGFAPSTIVATQRNAILTSWAGESRKQELLAELQMFVARAEVVASTDVPLRN